MAESIYAGAILVALISIPIVAFIARSLVFHNKALDDQHGSRQRYWDGFWLGSTFGSFYTIAIVFLVQQLVSV